MLVMTLLRDVAIKHLLTIEPGDSLQHAAKAMSDRGVGSAVVMHDGKVAGIITERDILQEVAKRTSFDDTSVNDVMTKEPVAGEPGWELTRAVTTMTQGGFRHLLVTEMDDPVGIVSLRDLMDAMVELVQDGSPLSD